MAWETLVPMQKLDGTIDPNGTVVAGRNSAGASVGRWDQLIDEMRDQLEHIPASWGSNLLAVVGAEPWTRGVEVDFNPKRLMAYGPNGDDGFYTSHLTDLCIAINACESFVGWPETTWSFLPIFYRWSAIGVEQPVWDDVADYMSVLADLRAAIDALGAMPINAQDADGNT